MIKDIHALIWQENDLFVAKAIEIEVASQGKNQKEAFDNLKEAVSLYFEDEKLPNNSLNFYKNIQFYSLNNPNAQTILR